MDTEEEISQVTAAVDKVILQSSDDVAFEVDVEVVSLSSTLKNMIEDCDGPGPVPVPNVTGRILSKVIEYCKKQAEENPDEDELEEWEAEFIDLRQDILYDLIKAANFLEIKGLLKLACRRVADMMRGKTADEIRKILKIEYDFKRRNTLQIRKEIKAARE